MIAVVLLLVFISVGQNLAQNTPGAIIASPPKHTTTSEGQTIRMTCAAYGKPTPSIKWTRLSDDVTAKLADSTSGYKQYDQTTTVDGTEFIISVLEICGVTVSDSDEYICTADNNIPGEGIASSEERFFLSVTGSVFEPPSIVVRPPSESDTVDYGNTIEAVCVAYGSPLPTITWTKEGCADISCSTNARIFTEIISYGDVSYRKSTLQLCSVDESNSGSYACSAMNGVDGDGVTPKSFPWKLTVNPKPTPPSTSHSIVVPSYSCPKGEMPTKNAGRESITNGGASPSPTTERQLLEDLANEQAYQVVVGIETVVVLLLLIVLVVGIIFIFYFRSRRVKEEKKQPQPIQSHAYSSKKKAEHGENEGGEGDELEDNANDEEYTEMDVSYANLVKKMEAES